ncbi:MAG TPA: hypothetical protein VNE59_14495 [Burkholderiales bacterium]|nr:hypothetical protein [Burkholderiales bacterium]
MIYGEASRLSPGRLKQPNATFRQISYDIRMRWPDEPEETDMQLTAVLTHAEEGGYVALNPETGTTTQGETVDEALANLREATALYLLEEFPLKIRGAPLVTTFAIPEDA